MRHGRSAADGLTGNVVAVTGGARGIGLATVDAFLDAGATVVIGDVDETRARDAASARGDRASGVALDVTNSTSFGEFNTAAARLSGSVDVLVNNAGPYGVHVAAVLPAVVGTDLSAGARYPRWIKPFVEVEPDEVAAAIVHVALTRGLTRTVPMALGLPVRASRLPRTPIRNVLEKGAGLDTAYTQADPAALSVYHRRIAASRD